MPQGSVLGPVLFNIYIRSIYKTAEHLKFNIHGYADDHQIFKSFSTTEQFTIFATEIPECFEQIRKWMDEHYLLINPDKTEIIVFGHPSVLSKITINGLFLENGVCIRFSPVVKNLGFMLDSELSFRPQVTKLKSKLFTKLRNISRMKPYLTSKQTNMLIQGVIINGLDYCNSMYYGCHQSVINQLQSIQNRACRLIFGLKKRHSVNNYLKDLHWLKIEERIKFKILVMVFKSIHGLSPT